MNLHVCMIPTDNPYTRRPLWGQPLGDYASACVAEDNVEKAKADYVAVITADMPLLTRQFLQKLAGEMRSMGIAAMRLGKGRLYAVGQRAEPKYRCGSEDATVVEDESTFARCAEALHKRIVRRAIRQGAVIVAPDTVYPDCTVLFAKGVYVHPFAVLQGRTVLGENAVLLPFCHLVDVTVGEGATVGGYHRHSVLSPHSVAHPYSATEHTGLGVDACVMPFGYATNALLGEGATLGGACLLEGATLQNRAQLPHGEVCRNKEIEQC